MRLWAKTKPKTNNKHKNNKHKLETLFISLKTVFNALWHEVKEDQCRTENKKRNYSLNKGPCLIIHTHLD